MPVVDLLRRTKSLRSPNGKTSAIDSEQPNILDFDFKNTLVEHRSKRNVKVAGKLCACSGYLLNQPTSGEAIHVEHHHYSSAYSHNTSSSQFSDSISNPRDSEIGIAITTPYEDSHFSISEKDEQSHEASRATSFDWLTFVRPKSVDHRFDNPSNQGKSKWGIIAGLLRKKSLSLASPSDQPSSKSSRDVFHQGPSHQRRDSGIPAPSMFQDGMYTCRCPSEWDYCFQQSPEVEKSPPNSRTDRHQVVSHVPSRKRSWRRTLSRKKSKVSERRREIQTTSIDPLSQAESHGQEHPLDFEPVQNDASPSSNTSGSSFLQVEIPTIKMERYSIMFSSLLQPAQPQPPSLLTRRQGPRAELRLEKRMKEGKEEPQLSPG